VFDPSEKFDRLAILAAMSEENVERYCTASAASDVDGMVETLTPDAELVSPISGRTVFRRKRDLAALLDPAHLIPRSLAGCGAASSRCAATITGPTTAASSTCSRISSPAGGRNSHTP
jgi:hypothetical protein